MSLLLSLTRTKKLVDNVLTTVLTPNSLADRQGGSRHHGRGKRDDQGRCAQQDGLTQFSLQRP